MVEITALLDNKTSGRRGLIAEHGLSLFVKYHGYRLLFDCGPGSGALHNARRLGIDLGELDGVILSHSHYDHAAGYRDLVESGMASRSVYTGPRFFEPKYSARGICYSNLSCGFDREFLKAHGVSHHEIRGAEQILPGVWLISGFPRVHPFETIPERFVRRTEAGFRQDDFCDEVCMALETDGGLTVLVGCSHPGILNMVAHIRLLLGKPVRAIFGGTHLVEAEPTRIEMTLRRLKELGVEILGLSHCSGDGVDQIMEADPDIQGCHLGSGESVFLD